MLTLTKEDTALGPWLVRSWPDREKTAREYGTHLTINWVPIIQEEKAK
jgi:hypothetical protein